MGKSLREGVEFPNIYCIEKLRLYLAFTNYLFYLNSPDCASLVGRTYDSSLPASTCFSSDFGPDFCFVTSFL